MLCMMGVPISGPTYIYGNNTSVIHNTQQPESTLKKKNLSIYYAVREADAMGEILMSHVQTKTISLTSRQRWPTDKSGATWWAPYYLTFMMTIPIRKADSQKGMLNDCWMSKLVPSKSDLLLWSSNLRGLRKLGQVETRRFPPYPALLQREGAFYPEQKEASWRERFSCNRQNGTCPWHVKLYQKIVCMRTEPEQNHWDHNQLTLTSRLVNLLVTPRNRARLSSTESDGYRLWQIHLPPLTIRLVIRLVCSRGNLHKKRLLDKWFLKSVIRCWFLTLSFPCSQKSFVVDKCLVNLLVKSACQKSHTLHLQ
jgi:hypothetical protein